MKDYQGKEKIARDWHPRLSPSTDITLKDELEAMEPFKLEQAEVPLIIRLVENPKYDIGIFPGTVSLYNHDCIHIMLGRGVLPKDEAFVIGFTMGSTGKMTNFKESLFCRVTKSLYPEGYKFTDEELAVYKMGLLLGKSMGGRDLSAIDFKNFKRWPISALRKKLGIDLRSLRYYYYLERQMFPDSVESQRLV